MNLITIAVNAYREGIRKKTLIAFLLFALLVIGSSSFLTVLSPTEELKFIKDICLTCVSLFGMLAAVFVSGSMVPNEVSTRTIHTVLSKPVRRWTYLLGKFFGGQLVVLLNLALMTLLFLTILFFREHKVSFILLKSVTLTFFELMILSALTLAVSVLATSPTLPIICGTFIYIVGHLVDYLKGLSEEAFDRGDVVLGWTIKLFYWVLPNLSNFNLRSELINLPPDDPTISPRFIRYCVYGVLVTVVGLFFAYWFLRRKEV